MIKLFFGFLLVFALVAITYSSKQVLIVQPTPAAYGNLWFHNDTNFLVVNTPNTINFFNLTPLNRGLFKNINVSDDNTTMTITISGIYDVGAFISFSDGNNQQFDFAVLVNGIEIDEIQSHRKLGSAGDVGSQGSAGLLNLSVGDILSVAIQHSSGSGVSVDVETSSFYMVLIEII